MDEYTTATCAACRQAVYIPRRLVVQGYWDCFACGATNISIGTLKQTSARIPPSRFARRRVIDLSEKEENLSLLRRLARRLSG